MAMLMASNHALVKKKRSREIFSLFLMISFSGNAYAYQELERTMNVLKRAYAQFYWQTWSNVNPALDIAHHNDIMQSIREKDLEKTQNYLKEDLADFCG